MRPVPTPELELLLRCARIHVDDDHAQRISGLLRRDLDWNGLVLMARRHGLIPLLYRTLSGLGSSKVPPEILERLRSLSEAFRFQSLLFVRELLNALRALETAGVTAMPYKGPALAAFLYQDLALRQFSDIDLLVRPHDAVKARHVLLKQGFVPKRRIYEPLEGAWVQFHCEFAFSALEGQVLVELNWRVAPRYWRLPEIPDLAWNRLGRLSLAGVSVPWFAPEDLLFVLCLHGCKHKWDTLKWLVDVAELLRGHPDLNWREMTDEARRTGSERMFAVGLFLANDLLDAPLPADVLEAVRCKPLVASLAAEVCENLLAAYTEPAGTLTELPFLARAAERLDMKLFCQVLRPLYFLLHRLVRPGIAALRQAAGVFRMTVTDHSKLTMRDSPLRPPSSSRRK
jgi:hypothetical protein